METRSTDTIASYSNGVVQVYSNVSSLIICKETSTSGRSCRQINVNISDSGCNYCTGFQFTNLAIEQLSNKQYLVCYKLTRGPSIQYYQSTCTSSSSLSYNAQVACIFLDNNTNELEPQFMVTTASTATCTTLTNLSIAIMKDDSFVIGYYLLSSSNPTYNIIHMNGLKQVISSNVYTNYYPSRLFVDKANTEKNIYQCFFLFQFISGTSWPTYIQAVRYNTCLLYTSPSPRDQA
eukprot:TRINITY_DN19755_c0_g1_i4.p1 TRINITY_DN19755_c0_g1~~TRINITY_DN19755_c0_g1_i4.p1  ORF type:complete len:235 (-),score=13.04 TRINITY_DN19755_c0_g1_i4:90-794(-)